MWSCRAVVLTFSAVRKLCCGYCLLISEIYRSVMGRRVEGEGDPQLRASVYMLVRG